MASVKLILRTKVNKDNTYPLALQFIQDRRKSVVHLGHSIKKTDWDSTKQRVKKSHPNSTRLNNVITKKLVEAQDKLLEMQSAKTDTSAQALRGGILSAKRGTFSFQGKSYCDDLEKSGKFNRLSADKPRVERFKEFMGYDPPFADITISVLKKYAAWLKGTRGISDRTVLNHLVVIRSIFSQAVAAGVVEAKHYPFGKGKIKIKFPDSSKAGLSADEIKTLEELELGNSQDHARKLFLFSFYFAGVRISDVLRLKWSNIQDGRLHYIMGKNNKGGSLKVPEKAMKIVECYRRDNPVHDLVFPDLEKLEDFNHSFSQQRRIKTRVHEINDNLKLVAEKAGITKKLTCHLSRHTFAQLAGEKVDIRVLQALYRHSDLKTTIGYQSNFITRKADDALDAVLRQ